MLATAPTPAATPAISALTPANYAFLQKFIYTESGIVVDSDKQYLLDSRLLPLVREAKLASLNELSELLAKRKFDPLGKRVVDAMTTNETLFYRDRAFFNALKTGVLPDLFERAKGRRVRIWSAAASTGQEAYSLAMMLLEMGKTGNQFEIVGTDITEPVLEKARAGQYTQFEVNRGLPAPLLMKYFTSAGSEWKLKDQVRSLVRFTAMDLRKSLSALGKFDLVFCRNVLIYFDCETKEEIFANLTQAMQPGALLALGCSESIVGVRTRLERRVIENSPFYHLKEV